MTPHEGLYHPDIRVGLAQCAALNELRSGHIEPLVPVVYRVSKSRPYRLTRTVRRDLVLQERP